MRFIVKNKIYDTDKAELIAEGKRLYKRESLLVSGLNLAYEHESKLYRTQKGAYYFTYECGKSCIQLVTEAEAKDWLMHADYDRYAELFGELEEG